MPTQRTTIVPSRHLFTLRVNAATDPACGRRADLDRPPSGSSAPPPPPPQPIGLAAGASRTGGRRTSHRVPRTRRAQFYIDHEWFLEAGEELPVHKGAPLMGSDHPFVVTSGHPRAGVNGMHSTDRAMMATTRGTPVAHINDGDTAARGIDNGQNIRIFNDDATIFVQARVAPAVSPGQVVLYTGFESYLYPEWKDLSNLETEWSSG